MNKSNFTSLTFCLVVLLCLQRITCLESKERNTFLMKRVSPACELKAPVKSAILNTETKVEKLSKALQTLKSMFVNLQKTVDDINASIQRKTTLGKNCADLYQKGNKNNGVYQIDPDGKGSFKVFCNMKKTGGGWIVFQRRRDGSVDFYRGWQDYKNGFGDLTGEFWLGLDKIHRLTTASNNKLRIDLKDTSGNTRYTEYDYFAVTSERAKYQLSVGTYSGNAGDSFKEHHGLPFSTKDSHNDACTKNCASLFKGAWWYKACHGSNLNGFYHHGNHKSYADGVNWYAWKGHHYSLKSTSMKIQPLEFGLKK